MVVQITQCIIYNYTIFRKYERINGDSFSTSYSILFYFILFESITAENKRGLT